MCHCWLEKRKYKVSAEEYAEAREKSSKFLSESMKERMKTERFRLIGTHHSEETKRKIGESQKGKIVSDETKEKMSRNHYDANGANNPRARKVRCVETGEIFYSIKSAIEWCGGTPHIYECIYGNRKSAGKHPVTGERLHWIKVN